MRKRYANLARIRTLDPERDWLEIYQTMLRLEFPWDMKLGLNLAFNRSFSIPAIAAVHVGTGELTERTQKRIDDTGLLMYEMVLNGFDEPRGREALRRVNQIHRPYDIPNEDYLYVLGCLVIIPTRWLQRYGWRRPCCHERRATYLFYRELGRRMGITDIPGSYEEFEVWFNAYDAAHLTPNDDAAAIERATRSLLLGRIPRPLAPLGDGLVSAMYDDRLRHAMQVDAPAWPVRAGLGLALKVRARLRRGFGAPSKTPLFADGIKTKTYPDGYEINRLGPQSHQRTKRPSD
ncbi:oxygenase MpaB family protein [Micromonospora aurantiaca]|uniref:oxygenase MpaB family protein n=1 Tax=Micromonospora aurantiaca (nom. illeg.) TaxID=47850 RepID=UPI002E16BCE8